LHSDPTGRTPGGFRVFLFGLRRRKKGGFDVLKKLRSEAEQFCPISNRWVSVRLLLGLLLLWRFHAWCWVLFIKAGEIASGRKRLFSFWG